MALRAVSWLVACIALASCAGAPSHPESSAPAPLAQEPWVVSDPPGAACDLLQQGVRVASVPSCPAVVAVQPTASPLDVAGPELPNGEPGAYCPPVRHRPDRFAQIDASATPARRPRDAALASLDEPQALARVASP